MNARLHAVEVIERIIARTDELIGILENSPEGLANVLQEYLSLKSELQQAMNNDFSFGRITCSEYERLLKSFERMLDIPARAQINRVEDYNEGGKNGKTIFFAVVDAKQRYEEYHVSLFVEIENDRIDLKNIEGKTDLFPKPNTEMPFSFTLEDNNLGSGIYKIYIAIMPLFMDAGISDKVWIEHVEVDMSEKGITMTPEVEQFLEKLDAIEQRFRKAQQSSEE